MESELPTIRTLARFLDTSAKRLDSAYTTRTAAGWPRGFAVSVLKPTPRGADQPIDVKQCAACGKVGGKLNACSRCMTTVYCSKSCQKADWKTHKSSCRAPSSAANSEIIEVDLTLPGDHPRLPVQKENIKMADVHPERHRFTIKIQICYADPGGGGNPQMVYDQRRRFAISILPSNCPGYSRLDDLIRRGANGKKGYFECYLKGTKLFILAPEMLPTQPW